MILEKSKYRSKGVPSLSANFLALLLLGSTAGHLRILLWLTFPLLRLLWPSHCLQLGVLPAVSSVVRFHRLETLVSLGLRQYWLLGVPVGHPLLSHWLSAGMLAPADAMAMKNQSARLHLAAGLTQWREV